MLLLCNCNPMYIGEPPYTREQLALQSYNVHSCPAYMHVCTAIVPICAPALGIMPIKSVHGHRAPPTLCPCSTRYSFAGWLASLRIFYAGTVHLGYSCEHQCAVQPRPQMVTSCMTTQSFCLHSYRALREGTGSAKSGAPGHVFNSG